MFWFMLFALVVVGVLGAVGVINFSKTFNVGGLSIETEVSKSRYLPFSIKRRG